jgi:hypothetical protein
MSCKSPRSRTMHYVQHKTIIEYKRKISKTRLRFDERPGRKCDQIRLFFAKWRFFMYFGQFFENNICNLSNFFVFLRLKLCTNFDKNGLGYILCDFLTNSVPMCEIVLFLVWTRIC